MPPKIDIRPAAERTVGASPNNNPAPMIESSSRLGGDVPARVRQGSQQHQT